MTKELIEEAREFLQSENAQYYDSSLIKALTDALEARQPTENDREAITGNELADAVSAYHVACGKPANSEGVRAVLALSRAAVPDAATERERADLWRSLDWMLWGVGMGDVFREPLADKMIAALSDAEFDQAQDLIRGWDALRGGPHERNLFVEIKAERDAARAEIESRIEDRDYWYGIADKAKSQRDAANEDRKQAEAEIRDLLKVDIPSLKAERDAALAAIERVRAIHKPDPMAPEWCVCEERVPCSTDAALDGAPEPEVKP